jgi:hypothetical protein
MEYRDSALSSHDGAVAVAACITPAITIIRSSSIGLLTIAHILIYSPVWIRLFFNMNKVVDNKE